MIIALLIVLPGLVLFLLSFLFKKVEYRQLSLGAVLTAALYPFSATLAWLISRHPIDPSESTVTWASNTLSVAKAGFPIAELQLPPKPMAAGFQSIVEIDVAVIHQLFWLGIALIAAIIITKLLPKKEWSNFSFLAVVSALFATFINYMLFALWFD